LTFVDEHNFNTPQKLIEMIPATIIDQQKIATSRTSSFSSLDIDYIIALENCKPEFYRLDEQNTVHVSGLRSDAEYMAEIKYSREDIRGKPEYFKFKTQSDQAQDKPVSNKFDKIEVSNNKQGPDF